jgi:hypothetical protein
MVSRLKISFVLVALATILAVGGYVYSLWAAERKNAAEVPVEAADKMMRDILSFHGKRGRFPEDLKELEGIVWDKKQDRNFSIKYRAISHSNYFYLYTRIDPHHFTLWSIPMGNLREQSPTGFLAASTEGCRRWKGPALDADLIRKLSVSPSPAELGVLGLTEQPGCDFTKVKKARDGFRRATS